MNKSINRRACLSEKMKKMSKDGKSKTEKEKTQSKSEVIKLYKNIDITDFKHIIEHYIHSVLRNLKV